MFLVYGESETDRRTVGGTRLMSLLKKIAHFKAHNYSTARIINLRLISSPEVATGLEVETFSRGSLRARLSAKGGEKAKETKGDSR